MDIKKMTDGFIVYHLDDLEGSPFIDAKAQPVASSDMVIRVDRLDAHRVKVEIGEWGGQRGSCILLNDQLADMAVQIIGYLTGNSFRQDPK